MIGTEGTFAPFSYHDDNDNLVGYDVEVSVQYSCCVFDGGRY